ncbi:ABC transporter substrate-binding protein [Candidatus Xianfuyuplasma coldseepsis]|uniref:Extracellular solute-binding protein n=1 Tax=Candidatus Xianfuyuplasma coldseepsis TaxID=2782163 RepID=A0A7L7KPT6_9MOLU|nr:extracellular solute-binding protein [Xianfuyuplasma coldseepsis]QMS84800.1 extracellular solute-binding protein [Xianfuyuplasma coldseepsis]
MKKLALFLVALVLSFGVLSSNTTAVEAADGTTLTIFQNKIEIDAVLTTYAEAWGVTNDVDVDVKSCGGDACAYGTQILAEFQAAEQPDIFVIEGMGGYNQYADKILDLTGEAWAADTGLEFVVDGVVYGFPVAVEGWGMGYNKEILTAAGVDPEDLTNLAAYEDAFDKIQTYYDADATRADYAVVSMAAGAGMTWVTGLHNFNAYLSAQLDYTDSTVIDKLNNEEVDMDRLNDLADWVELLFEYADTTILETGTYDDQVGKFANGEAAFIHQGNWIDGNLTDATFEMGYAPHAAMSGENTAIFIGAPSFYVINKDSDNIADAKAFLNDLASTTEGHDYMVNEANMVPAFDSVTLTPSTPLSAEVMAWNQAGNAYAWWQNDMPAGFGMDTLGPIYELFAKGTITKAQFVDRVALAIDPDYEPAEEQTGGNTGLYVAIGVGVVAVAGVGFYFFTKKS